MDIGLYGGMVDAADSKFVTFWFVGSSPSTSNFKNIDSLMVERLSHNQEVEGSIPSRCIFNKTGRSIMVVRLFWV